MDCPFLREEPVAEDAMIVRRAFRINPVLRDRQYPLAQRNAILHERCRFSREGVIHLIHLLEPQIKCSTRRSQALTTAQTVCIALRFFACGTFLYTIGDAENLAKSAVCRAIRKVYLALKQLLRGFVFPSHLTPQVVKQNFYAIAGSPHKILLGRSCNHDPCQ